MVILNHARIQLIIERMAIEVLENNAHQEEIVLLGINNSGHRLAELIFEKIRDHTDKNILLNRVTLSPQDPLQGAAHLQDPIKRKKRQTIILVDDVANTGRTLYYASLPILDLMPDRLEAAVLIDRKHKNYPMHVKYVGLSLATTLQENIEVDLTDIGAYRAVLE